MLFISKLFKPNDGNFTVKIIIFKVDVNFLYCKSCTNRFHFGLVFHKRFLTKSQKKIHCDLIVAYIQFFSNMSCFYLSALLIYQQIFVLSYFQP
jgi:hypothetical protein